MAVHRVLLLFALFTQTSAETASFYGDSHVIIPYQNSSSTTVLSLRFKTHLPSCLLFLASGTTDYLLLQLNHGKLSLRADFGSGEITLNTTGSVTFNDGNWHQVLFDKQKEVIWLQIDATQRLQTYVEGRFTQLDIETAVFVAGTGRFRPRDLPVKKLPRKFRGCMSKVIFNSFNVLETVQSWSKTENVHKVLFSCDPIFDADKNVPISFTSSTSFIVFSDESFLGQTRKVSFDVKTHSETALLLFTTISKGLLNDDFLALEILQGKLVSTLSCRQRLTVINLESIVNDGEWHQVMILIQNFRLVRLQMDNEVKYDYIQCEAEQSHDLIFMGGLGSYMYKYGKYLQPLFPTNIPSTATDYYQFNGCVRDINLDSSISIGFPNILISNDISTQCMDDQLCYPGSCRPGSVCVQGEHDFQCVCQSEECIQQQFEENLSTRAPILDDSIDSKQLVEVYALEVFEGSEKAITTDNIKIKFNFKSFNIRESAIQFHVISSPEHGFVDNYLGRRRNRNVFTLLDIMGEKVFYRHDGSETMLDQMSIEMDIVTDGEGIPPWVVSRYAFVLLINIKPVNDPPTLNIINNGHITMVHGTKFSVSDKVLSVADPDTDPKNITFMIHCMSSDKSYFEKSRYQDDRIESFTYEDVQHGYIWFVNKGPLENISCSLTISDGIITYENYRLVIEIVELQMTLVKNIRTDNFYGSNVLITDENLLVSTNVPDQDLEIRYEIVTPPKHGIIQRMHSPGLKWGAVNSFAQRHLAHRQIRYSHTDLSQLVPFDEFTFRVKCLDQIIDLQTFSITLDTVTLTIVSSGTVRINKVNYKKLTTKDILIMTNTDTPMENIIFTIAQTPIQGDLYIGSAGSPVSDTQSVSQILNKNDIFSLQDVADGKIVYALKRQIYSRREDYVDLTVSAPGANHKRLRLHFESIPAERDVRFTNNVLNDVVEGSKRTIERNFLYLETIDYREFEFNILQFPSHGVLQIVDERTNAVEKSNISRFTNEDIRLQRLVYKHDDSEHASDRFRFSALPIIQNTNDLPMQVQKFTGMFEIRILMRNDNPPERVVDKIFDVVTNQEKVITLDDIAFADPDIEYDPMDLTYRRREIPNGDIIFTLNKSSAYTFTQRDIAEGRISFKHSGDVYGRTVIWVSDGSYYTTSLFEVQASEPSIIVVNNTGLIVHVGESVNISTHNLSVTTNVNLGAEDILFVIQERCQYGHVEQDGRAVLEFTFRDVKEGSVAYVHTGQRALQDEFVFTVMVGSARTGGTFVINTYAESQNELPRVVNNNVLQVMETGTETILERNLLVSHLQRPARPIVYTLRSLPSHGRIIVHGQPMTSNVTFTQDDINEGQISYHHLGIGTGYDGFEFDVSNGFRTLHGLEFLIEIKQSSLQLNAHNFTIQEGGEKPLTPSMLSLKELPDGVTNVNFVIIHQPQHGWIENVGARGQRLETFTSHQLGQGEIYFVHDDSEEASDHMSIKAHIDQDQQESAIENIYITVETKNDQAPVIVTNKGLSVWARSTTPITRDVLMAEDVDSPPEDIMFTISRPTNGKIILSGNRSFPVTNFTQALVDEGKVFFVHHGDPHGDFVFFVSDGRNTQRLPQTFVIRAAILMLDLVRNHPMKVYPGRRQPITDEHLFSSTNDPNHPHPIMYHIVKRPRKGRLITLYEGQPLEILSFRQEDISNQNILYEHTSEIDWQDEDLFFFSVTTLYASPITDERFMIKISYVNIPPDDMKNLVQIENLFVREGDEVHISPRNIDFSRYAEELRRVGKRVSIFFVLDTLPKAGSLLYENTPVKLGETFNQEDINLSKLKYRHDNSETYTDSFDLSIYVDISLNGTNPRSELMKVNLNVTIQPVNDLKFQVVTRNPSVRVVQGMTVAITSNDLKTIDPDTPPSDLEYVITSPAENGFISFLDEKDKSVLRFTQEDIDTGKLLFTHNGRGDSGNFRFQVSDGKFAPVTKVFVINVVPIFLQLGGNKTASIIQGRRQVRLTSDTINSLTNGQRKDIRFNVTKQPMNGEIMINDRVISFFSQKDIDSGYVVYKQNDLTASSDYFVCDLYYPSRYFYVRVKSQQINVVVKPLVKQKPLQARTGNIVYITKDYLDASELANLTSSEPQYSIVNTTKHGRIAFSVRGKRDLREQSGIFPSTLSFSHTDVINKKVTYIPYPGSHTQFSRDYFTFRLTANGVQPAIGTMEVQLNAKEDKTVFVTAAPWDGEGHDEDIFPNSTFEVIDPRKQEVVSPNMSSDYIVIIAILIPLFLLLIAAAVFVYIMWKRHQHTGDYLPGAQKYLRPYTTNSLEQPHVHIEPQDASIEDHDPVYTHHHYHNVSPPGATSVGYDHRHKRKDSDICQADLEVHRPLIDSPEGHGSPSIPDCKVTSLGSQQKCSNDLDETAESLTPSDSMIAKSNNSLNLYDWSVNDPDFLQHCRTTHPILRDSQYWV